jgi:superoxide dismutase, Fe-Mn family
MGQFTLPDLPYAYDALEPYIDAETMTIHHTKHHQTYVDKLNAAMEKRPSLGDKTVDELLDDFDMLPEEIRAAVRNHGGGHSNHSILWKTISPNGGGEPEGALATAIENQVGSFKKFKEAFTAKAVDHFGSGWVWLVVVGGLRKSKDEKRIQMMSLPNQDSPIMGGHTPIFGIDLWEHAYYLKYQNKRPDYVKAFWEVVDWKACEERMRSAGAVSIQYGTVLNPEHAGHAQSS